MMSARSHLVFFVDDEPAILASIRRALLDDPWRLRTFSTPEEALVRIPQERPSVVVSDYYMPSMRGCDFLEKVLHLDESIVRVILTGKPDVSNVVRSVEKGAIHRFLVKPWSNPELRAAVRDAILQHEMQIERRELMGEIRQTEQDEYRKLLKLDAEMHLAGRPGGGARPRGGAPRDPE